VTTYEYPGYQVDKDLTADVLARVERVSAMLSKILSDLKNIDMEAVGGDGDVILSVNHLGQLMSLSLAQGCTRRYTHVSLADLINSTLEQAVEAAAAEGAAAAGVDDEDALQSAVDELADPDSEIWLPG